MPALDLQGALVAVIVILSVLLLLRPKRRIKAAEATGPTICPKCRLFIGTQVNKYGVPLASCPTGKDVLEFACSCGCTSFWEDAGGLHRLAFSYTRRPWTNGDV